MSKVPRQRGRWSQPTNNIEMTVKSMLDLRQLESFSVSRSPSRDSLSQNSNGDDREEQADLPTHINKVGSSIAPQDNRSCVRPQVIRLLSCEEGIFSQELEPSESEECVIYPEQDEIHPTDPRSEYQVKALPHGKLNRSYQSNGCPDKHSPDSACSVDYSSSRLSSPDHPNEDSESTEPLSVDGISDLEGEEGEEDVGTSVPVGEIPQAPDQEKFLKQHFGTLGSTDGKGGSCRSLERTENLSISSRFLSQSPALRRLSLSSSNLILDSKSIESPAPTSRFTQDLLKNDSSHPADALENSHLLNNVNLHQAVYAQKKRKSALETSRVGMAPGRVIASFPEGPVNAVMRKAQSVHDLVHEDKGPGVVSSAKQRPHTLMVVEKDPRPNNCRALSSSLLKMDGSGALLAKDVRAAKPKSYMNPTTSFRAKMSRSISVGENLYLGYSTDVLTDGRTSPPVAEKTQFSPTADAEKMKLTGKENYPVKPALQPVVNCSSPKSFHSKLASSNRAHLILDIPKPLPDRPTLASFSPTTKTKTLLEPQSPQSPAGACKKKPSFPEVRTSKKENQAAGSLVPGRENSTGLAKESPVESPISRTGCQFEPGVTNLKLREFSEVRQLKSPESTLPRCKERITGIACVLDNQPGLCPLDPIRPRSPTSVTALAQVSESSISVEQCEHVVSELQDSMRKAIHLYRAVLNDTESSTDKDKIAGLLTETFSLMKKELDSLKDEEELPKVKEVLTKPQDTARSLNDKCGANLPSPKSLGDEQTLALLEQYSELLLQAVERRMDKKL